MAGTPGVSPVLLGEYPPAADLRTKMRERPLPTIAPETVDPAVICSGEATSQALAVLGRLNVALASDDAVALENCFFPDQAYWKDELALTWHLRTFTSPPAIAASLLQTKALHSLAGPLVLEGTPQFVPASPVLVGHRQRRKSWSSSWRL